MSSQPAVQWNDIEQILLSQPGAQMPFGQYIVNLGPVQGSVINIAPQGQQAADQLRPRAQAPQVLPRQVDGFLDRGPEQRVIGEALARAQVVDVHGPDGAGKTSLLSQAMHLQFPGDYPAGRVYLTVRHDTREDLLQDLVEHFYEAEHRHVKVGENEVRRLMAGRKALIVLDDANHLGEGEAEAIAQAVPQAAFVVAGREPQVWQGQAVALGGLPGEQALALFERHLGRPLNSERPVVEAICRALDGMPLAIVKAARTAGLRRVALAQVLREVQPQVPEPQPVKKLFWMLGQHLTAGERQVLAALAAPGGPSVGRAAVAHISAVASPSLEEHLLRLERLGLLEVEGDRYSLDDALRPYLRRHALDDEMLARAAGYYLKQAGALRARSRHADEENVIAALAYYAERGRWREVLYIVRGMEAYLVTSGRWGQWRKRLENAWHAGRVLGDPRTEAWAQNQLGIVALAAGDARRAATLFRGALRIWRAIGDRTGADIARWNLQILLGPPPPGGGGEPEPVPGGGGSAVLPVIMGGIAATLLTILVLLLWLVNGRAVAPITVVATTTPVTPAATTPVPTVATNPVPGPEPTTPVPPPSLEVWLVEGCDRAYIPGELVEVRAQSNLAGTLNLYVRDPNGRRQHVLRTELPAGGVTRGLYTMPEDEGRWRLEAELDGGRAAAACAFQVVPEPEPLPPLIEAVRIQPAMEEPVCPEDPVWILADISSEPGLRAAVITIEIPGRGASSEEMEHIDALTYGYRVAASEEPGLTFAIEAEDVDGRRSRTTEMVYAVEACVQILYDFVSRAPEAAWSGLAPGDQIEQIPAQRYDLSFPGSSNDDEGSALWLEDVRLEEGTPAGGRVLQTHPPWTRGGAIRGDYRLLGPDEILFQPGDRFVARVGLPEEAKLGHVTFEVWFWPAGSEFGQLLLGTLEDSHDGQVLDWSIPLDGLAGQRGTVRLAVQAGDDFVDDRALWIEARIER